jgi:hypothetical protein
MRRGILILVVAFLIVFRPGLGRAETRVYVSVSVDGAAVIGAGVLYWSLSYTSRVSEHRSPEQNPGVLSLTTDASRSNSPRSTRLIPQSQTAEERTRADFASIPDGPRAASSVEMPLLVFRW